VLLQQSDLKVTQNTAANSKDVENFGVATSAMLSWHTGQFP